MPNLVVESARRLVRYISHCLGVSRERVLLVGWLLAVGLAGKILQSARRCCVAKDSKARVWNGQVVDSGTCMVARAVCLRAGYGVKGGLSAWRNWWKCVGSVESRPGLPDTSRPAAASCFRLKM